VTQAVKTSLTLAVLALLVAVGASWGWSALTAPLPKLAEAPTCVETPIEPGDTITPAQVTVSVLNAGKRVGLATRTMTALTGQGFNKGDRGNAPSGTAVGNAQIWTDDPTSPAVALVASRIPRVGVVLVVGDRFDAVRQGVPSVRAVKGTTICSPPT